MAPKAKGGGWCVCKYCHRSNKDTVNPWVPSEWQGRDQGDSSKMMLQFRRDRGKECSSCCALIRSNKRDYFVDPNLDKLLEADANKQSEFLQDLEEFESKKRSDALAKASRVPSKKIEAKHATGFKMRMVMGYFWPLDVLKREGKPIPKSLTTMKFNGKSLKGAVLDPSHGTPIGVIEMESYDEKSASKVSYHESNFKIQMFCEFIP